MKCLWASFIFCAILHVSTSFDLQSPHVESVLECCDLNGFIDDSFGEECDFKLLWTSESRLSIYNNTNDQKTTTTEAPNLLPDALRFDIQVLPQTCEIEECVFKKLQVIDHEGYVDTDAFTRLLDNMTRDHPDWASAKARVITSCIPSIGYSAQCEINQLLSCTFDVLSENCPHHKDKMDNCKHKNETSSNVCQISTSKFRPKKRRAYCQLPQLVDSSILEQCGANSLSYMMYKQRPKASVKSMQQFIRRPNFSWLNYKPSCKTTMESTKCLMNKMGVLNRYGFVDYYKMKSKIRKYTTEQSEWSDMKDTLLNIFTSAQFYGEHCTSQRKLLNIIDTLLSTCPSSKRKNSQFCDNFFTSVRGELQITESQKKLNYIVANIKKSYHPRPLVNSYQYGPFSLMPKLVPNPPVYRPYSFYIHNITNPNHLYSRKRTLVLVPVYQGTDTTNVYERSAQHNGGDRADHGA